jgi:hypothetical protein
VPRLKKIESLADVIRRLSPEEVPIAVSYLPLRDPTEKPLDEGWAIPAATVGGDATRNRRVRGCAQDSRMHAQASVGDPQQCPCFAGVGGCSGATCHRAPILRQSGLSCAILSLRLE